MEFPMLSILDNDLYKFTMQYAVIEKFPKAKVRYRFVNRGITPFPSGFDKELGRLVEQMSDLYLTQEEKQYLREKCYYLPEFYLDFLEGYRYDPSEVTIMQRDGDLELYVDGFWYRTILWEVPLMALISELYFTLTNQKPNSYDIIKQTVVDKAKFFNDLDIRYADFGTRRRYSYKNHDLVVKLLKENGRPAFIGTSNVHLAHKYSLTPIGTQAHEWFMYHGAAFGYTRANELALENWADVFQGNLGIALADTFTSEVFFRSFNTKLSKLFDGVRQDSGDPIKFAMLAVDHYKKLRIDPISKVIVFSDALNPQKVKHIVDIVKGKIGISFGIGTNLTNDVGVTPLNIVIKMDSIYTENGRLVPTIKLSDDKGKYTGNREMIEIVKKLLLIDD